VTKLQFLILQHLIVDNKGSKDIFGVQKSTPSEACRAVKIHRCNSESGVRFSLSVLFIFLFLLLVHIWSRYQKPSCPSDSPSTFFCPPSAVNHQNTAQRFSEGRDVQLGLCHHPITAVISKSLTCQGRKDRLCTVTVLKH